MREFLVYVYPYVLFAALAAWAALAALRAAAFVRAPSRPFAGKALAAAACIAAGALALRGWGVPHRHYVFFDEYEHFDIARNMASGPAFAETLAGGTPGLAVLSAPGYPGAFHAVLGLAFAAFGAKESTAFALNAVLGSLCVLWIYLLAAETAGDAAAGLLAAFFLAVSPTQLRFSGSGDLSVGSQFWLLAALFFAASDAAREDLKGEALFLLTLLLAAHSRLENVFFAPAVLLFAGHPKDVRRKSLRAVFWAALAPVFLIIVLNIRSGRPGYWEAPGAVAGHFLHNAWDNLRFLAMPSTHHLVLIPLAAVAVFRGPSRSRRFVFLLLGMFVYFFLFYSCYHIGDFSMDGSSRYSLTLDIPLLALAGLGAADLFRRPAWRRWALPAVLLSCVIPCPVTVADEADGHQREDRFIHEAASSLPDGVYVVAFSPAAILAAGGRPAVSPYFVLENAQGYARLLDGGRGLVLFKDYWWYERPAVSRRVEALLAERYASAPLAETRVDSKAYGFYRLTPRR